MKKTELINTIREAIHNLNEQVHPVIGVGYTGGTPCYACINNQVETLLFPSNALGQPYPSCAPTAYGWSGTQYALPGGSASYNYPSIWSEDQNQVTSDCQLGGSGPSAPEDKGCDVTYNSPCAQQHIHPAPGNQNSWDGWLTKRERGYNTIGCRH